jgi:acetyl esterase/lipase
VEGWPSELEALRDPIRPEAAELIAAHAGLAQTLFPSGPDWGPDPTALAGRRAMYRVPQSEGAEDRRIDGPAGPIRLRIFRPAAPARAVLLNIHGGGWVMGAPEMNDLANSRLSGALGIAVVSPDYRLAPEHPYPAAHDDCEAAAHWLVEHAEREFGSPTLLINGESAGSHLAAVTLLSMRDRLDAAHRFAGADLQYGIYDCTQTPSQLGVGSGPDSLDPVLCLGFVQALVPLAGRERLRDPDVSPLYADLGGMPPGLFTVGTADHFSSDTLFMASRWAHFGNSVELLAYPGAPHGCTRLPAVDQDWAPRQKAFLEACIR